jgi:hypothetical protein
MKIIRLTLILAALAGCSGTTRLSEQRFEPKPADAPIEVITVTPQRPYIELAQIRVDNGPFASDEGLIEDAKVKARECGGDAIVVQRLGWSGGNGSAGGNKMLIGTAIRWDAAKTEK